MSRVVRLAHLVLYAPQRASPRPPDAETWELGPEQARRHPRRGFGLLFGAGRQAKSPPVRHTDTQVALIVPSIGRQETIHQIAQATQQQLIQIGRMHRTAAALFAEALADGARLVRQSEGVRPLTLDEYWLLSQLRQALLEEILITIVVQVDRGTNQWLDGEFETIDDSACHAIKQLTDAYLQRVRMILFSQEENDDEEGTESIGASSS